MAVNELYARLLKQWESDPASFINTFWKPDHHEKYTWAKQEDICRALIREREVWIKSCNSSGKTDLAGKLVVWFMACFMPDCLVVTIAPTDLLLRLQLWGQVRAAYGSAKYKDKPVNFGGKLMPSEPYWKVNDLCYAIGLSPRPKEKERVQGFHQKKILLLIDEASGVSDDIFDAIEALKASGDVYVVIQGNPLRTSGAFYRGFKYPGKGVRITISGKDACRAGITGLINRAFMDDQKAKFDRGENPLYEARCLGEFPSITIDGLYPPFLLDRCFNNPVDIHQEQLLYGSIDWAYGGQDSTVFTAFNNGVQTAFEIHPRMEAPEAATMALVFAREHHLHYLFADDCGGGKVCNQFLNRMVGGQDDPFHKPDIEIIPLDSAGEGDEIHYNARSRFHHDAKAIMQSGVIKLIPHERAREESQTISYWNHPRTKKLLVTSKEDIKAIYHASPDYWDAIVYALEGYKILLARKAEGQKLYSESDREYTEEPNTDDGSIVLGVRTE